MSKINIDYIKLRRDLIEFFGTAMIENPLAIMDLTKVQNASNELLEQIAIRNGFVLSDYYINVKRYTI